MEKATTITRDDILLLLESVTDPEIPVLSVLDLGLIRDILPEQQEDGTTIWNIVITPTYSGCPAMDVIITQIRMVLLAQGLGQVRIQQTLSPAWTTEWITEAGRAKLREYGIAPPARLERLVSGQHSGIHPQVSCPLCNSAHTHQISAFGSTACKALYQCDDCLEPFDYFKCH